MEINVIGSRETEFKEPRLLEGELRRFYDFPRFNLNPFSWIRYWRKLKKCTVIFWDARTFSPAGVQSQAYRALLPFWKAVVKLPAGPAILVLKAPADPFPWDRFADKVIDSSSHYLSALKEAYFIAECGHPSNIYKEKKQKERIQWLKDVSRGKVLEIGCSTGYVLDYVGGGVGVDIDDLRLEYARSRYHRSQFLKADGSALPFSDKEFDTVLIPDILEHVDYEYARSIVKEATRVGKRLIITVPNAGKPNYDKALVENPEHRWFPTEQMMYDLLGRDIDITYSSQQDFIYCSRA